METAFASTLFHKARYELVRARKPSEALQKFLHETFADYGPDVQNAFVKQYRERTKRNEIVIDSRRRVIHLADESHPNGYYLETSDGEGHVVDNVCVIRGPFEIHRQSWVESRPVIEAEDDVGLFSGDFALIFKRLADRGRILSNRLGKDVLAHLISEAPQEEGGWAAFGVYADDHGNLTIPKFSPQTHEQQKYLEAATAAFDYEPTEVDWRDYAALRGVYDAHEAMPSFGAAAIAPLAFVLRDHNRIVPMIVSWSPQPGTGKSELAKAMSRRLWLSYETSGDALKTHFRFISKLECACVAFAVDEAQAIPWDELGDVAKQAMEASHVSGRGRGSGSEIKEYLSRATLLLTSNTLPQIHRATLARMVLARFRGGHLLDREPEPWLEEPDRKLSKQEFRSLTDRLQPCGFAMARTLVKMFPTTDALLDAIASTARDFDLCGIPIVWSDARRPQIWGTIYLGLKVWERASGGLVPCPSIAEFLTDTVSPCERESKLTERDSLRLLADHIRMFIARNQMNVYARDGPLGETVRSTVSRGEDLLWTEGLERNADGDVVSGWWITSAMLEDYNRSMSKDREAQIRSLPDVSRAGAAALGREEEAFLDADGSKPKVRKVQGFTLRMAFVPDLSTHEPRTVSC